MTDIVLKPTVALAIQIDLDYHDYLPKSQYLAQLL